MRSQVFFYILFIKNESVSPVHTKGEEIVSKIRITGDYLKNYLLHDLTPLLWKQDVDIYLQVFFNSRIIVRSLTVNASLIELKQK